MLEADLNRNKDGTLRLALAGSLDENADVEQILAKIDDDVVIDLRAIKRLNSMGVHRWVTAIRQLTDRHSVYIECCSYPVALQASYVANLFGSAKIVSTLAPYFCNGCGYNGMELVGTTEVTSAKPPAKRCPSCKVDMQFDELDTYLGFLSPVN